MKVTKFFCHSFHRYSIKHITNIFNPAPCHFLPMNTFSGLELFRIQKFSLSLWAPDMQKMPCSTLKNDLGRTNLEKDFAIKPCHFSQMKAVFSYPLIFSTAQETLFHIHEKAPVWQSNVFTFRALCVTGTHKMESTFMFPISDGLIFHLFCARPLSFVTWRTPLSQRRTNEADLRPTHMRWIRCGVLMRWRRRLRILSPLYAPFPFLKRRVGGWLLSVHSLHLLSQSLDLNFFSLLFPPSLPFFHFTQFPPLFSCASHLSFSAVCSTVCAFPTALCPLLLSVCVLRRNRESV